MFERHSLRAQADALDALLSGDAVGAMYRGRPRVRLSEADRLSELLSAARDTLRRLEAQERDKTNIP